MSGSYYIYSLADLGISGAAVPTPGDTYTTSASPAPDFLNILDDDPLLDPITFDPATGAPILDINQVLATDLVVDGVIVGNAGDFVSADVGGVVFLTDTGTAINGNLIIVVDPVTGVGNAVGLVTTVPVPASTPYTFTGTSAAATVPYATLANCFTADTMIECENGPKAVQDITEGDLIITRDSGLQAVRWVGRRVVAGTGDMAPVRIKAGVLGNSEDLLVSPMHRMVINGPRAEALFGEAELLAHASHLCDGDRIFKEPVLEVTYFHLLFDKHEIISAFGCWSESFAPSKAAMSAVDEKTHTELLKLFPQLGQSWQDVLPTLSAAEAKMALL